MDYREGLAKKVESDMISMMDQLSELIEKEEPLFKGKMLQCGSSYNAELRYLSILSLV